MPQYPIVGALSDEPPTKISIGNKGLLALISSIDKERVQAEGSWSELHVPGHVYAKHDWKIGGFRGTILLHRFILNVHKLPRSAGVVAHLDDDGLNCQRHNLVFTTDRRNQLHKTTLIASNRSGVNGVYWNNQKQKWHAELHIYKRKIHVGFFNSLEEATAARIEAQLKYQGVE